MTCRNILVGTLSLHFLLFLPAFAAAEDSEPSWRSQSRDSLYQLRVHPVDGEVQIGSVQQWIVNLATQKGAAVFPAEITVGGGMQSHKHGLPTQPKVTAYGGDGDYLIEGIRFSMEGTWRLSFRISAAPGNDIVDIDIDVSF